MPTKNAPSIAVGMAGLGQMGRPIAECLLASGLKTIVYDISADARQAFSARASIAGTIAELGDMADVVIGCLPTLAAYEDAIGGPTGLAHGKRVRTYLHIGTTGAILARQLSAQLAARGVALVDAPVTGGVRGAQKGKLSSMVSGPADAIAIVRPVIDAYSSRIILFGDQPGAAQTVKLINNVLSNANLALALEALAFGAKAGIDVRDTLDLVNSGTGQNFATSVLIPEHVLPRSFASGGALAIVLKDMNILLDEADALGAPMPLARATLNLFRATEADFGPAGDWTLIGQHIEQQAGIILRSVDKS